MKFLYILLLTLSSFANTDNLSQLQHTEGCYQGIDEKGIKTTATIKLRNVENPHEEFYINYKQVSFIELVFKQKNERKSLITHLFNQGSFVFNERSTLYEFAEELVRRMSLDLFLAQDYLTSIVIDQNRKYYTFEVFQNNNTGLFEHRYLGDTPLNYKRFKMKKVKCNL